MSRRITPRTSIDTLKREAKRWLQALRSGDANARERFARAIEPVPQDPGLRQVQHALAREFAMPGWSELVAAVTATRSSPVRIDGAALTRLLRAAADGDRAAVLAALDANPAMVSERGTLRGHTGRRAALHFATSGSHTDIVRLLLDRGADPNVRDEGDNALPLHFAAEKEDLAIIEMLVSHGSDVIGAGDDHQLDVIGWATVFGSARRDVVEYLLSHGARHNIFSAIVTGDLAAIERIARADRSQLDRSMDRTNRRRRPLHLAVVKRQLGALDTLLALAAPVDRRDAAGLTPLDQAALDGQVEMIEHLLAAGARIELPAAVALDRADQLRQLLRDELDVLRPGHRLGTLIIRAAERGSARVIDALVAGGADVNVEDDDSTSVDGTHGYTALHAAAFAGNVAAARALIAHGARVTARDTEYSGTPVGWAAFARRDEMVKLLLEAPIDIFDAIDHHRLARIRDLVGADRAVLDRPMNAYLRVPPREDWWLKGEWTPLAFAVAIGHDDAAALLEELGAAVAPAIIARFLELACPDHHVRGASDHLRVRSAAMRLLADHPELNRASLATAIVCGNLADVRRRLTANPGLATAPTRPSDARSGPGSAGNSERDLPAKEWTPLLFLCFARLSLPESAENAVAIAEMLLDHGADPNAYFMAGNSRYTPLVGVIGEGEEDRPAHPRRDELTRLLLARGADPYDQQVGYNIGFKGKVLWFLQLSYARSVELGLAKDWDDPAWMMLNMGNYGSGARWYLGIAVRHDDRDLAAWCLSHGADPDAEPPRAKKLPKESLHELAIRGGRKEIAELLLEHGARRVPVALTDAQRLLGAAVRRDAAVARDLVGQYPDLRTDPFAIGEAVMRNDVDAVRILLDAGVPVEAVNSDGERPLHIAAWSNAPDVARLLVERGAEIDSIRGNYHNTALGAAEHFRLDEMIDFLSTVSRDIWELVYLGKIERVRELLAEEPALARVGSATQTPLMWLPVDDEGCAIDLATLLLAHGADPSVVHQDGVTAADIAERNGMRELAAVLRAGADGGRPTVPHYEAMAERLLEAYRTGTPEAMRRHWDDTWHRREWSAMRRYVLADLGIAQADETVFPDITIDDARRWVARDHRFHDWNALVREIVALPANARAIARTPVSVFHELPGGLPIGRIDSRNWEAVIAAIRDRRLTSIDAHGQMTDALLARIADLPSVTSLRIGGSSRVTDEGIRHLARMPQLRRLDLRGTGLTDRGATVLRELPSLEDVSLAQTAISPAGVAHLAACELLTDVNLSWTRTGDEAIRALAGKRELRRLMTGADVTDRGLPLLREIPRFASWHGGTASSAIFPEDREPNRLVLRGIISDTGMESLVGLDGLFGLDLDVSAPSISPRALIPLAELPHLEMLSFDATDEAMPLLAALPALRLLSIQDTVAGDDGFVALSRSRTIERIWGRRCRNLKSRGFAALASMPSLRSMAVSCKNVGDDAVALLPTFPALRHLMPMDVPDAGYRHIAACEHLESLILMYCRDTTDHATELFAPRLRLRKYFASYTQITDRTPELLATMASLERVQFDACAKLTTMGLASLARLPALQVLAVNGSPQVTEELIDLFPPRVGVRYGD